jgi:hypothetical protein
MNSPRRRREREKLGERINTEGTENGKDEDTETLWSGRICGGGDIQIEERSLASLGMTALPTM